MINVNLISGKPNYKYLYNLNLISVTMKIMTEHVFRKFPNDIKGIRELFARDATFREICGDYEEMCTWLDDYCHLHGRPSEECDTAREIIRDLEDEIEKVLKDRGF